MVVISRFNCNAVDWGWYEQVFGLTSIQALYSDFYLNIVLNTHINNSLNVGTFCWGQWGELGWRCRWETMQPFYFMPSWLLCQASGNRLQYLRRGKVFLFNQFLVISWMAIQISTESLWVVRCSAIYWMHTGNSPNLKNYDCSDFWGGHIPVNAAWPLQRTDSP